MIASMVLISALIYSVRDSIYWRVYLNIVDVILRVLVIDILNLRKLSAGADVRSINLANRQILTCDKPHLLLHIARVRSSIQ